jgi:hypothetical protein
VADSASPAYEDLPSQIQDLLERLRRHTDPEVSNDALRVQMWIDEFNRVGVHRVVELILAWRGEIFLEDVFRDQVAATFLARYGITEPS